MVNSLYGYLVNSPAAHTQTVKYRATVESLLTYFKNAEGTTTITVSPEEGFLYRGDLSGYLLDKGFLIEDHYLIMRLNDLTSIHDFGESTQMLLIPDAQAITTFKQQHLKAFG